MLILGVMDSFKGTLSSIRLGKILVDELRKNNIYADYIPMTDGGDGFLDVIGYGKGLEKRYVYTVDPLNRKIREYYLYDKYINTAYIEFARTGGLSLLKEEEYNPFITTSYGVGLMIKDAINKNVKNIVIGIGGSSTNDGGSGILAALGVQFYNEFEKSINYLCNDSLFLIKRIDDIDFLKKIKGINFKVVSDVQNVLLGLHGATYTYAPQKGAKFDDLAVLEDNMVNYSNLIENLTGGKFSLHPGSGAAGGVGFMFLSMFNAKLVKGIDYILDYVNFDKYKDSYDYIITGEGKIDKQSLDGKVVMEIIKRSKPKKVIVLSAINELGDDVLKELGAYKSYSIVGKIASLNESKRHYVKYFRQLVSGIEFEDE